MWVDECVTCPYCAKANWSTQLTASPSEKESERGREGEERRRRREERSQRLRAGVVCNWTMNICDWLDLLRNKITLLLTYCTWPLVTIVS